MSDSPKTQDAAALDAATPDAAANVAEQTAAKAKKTSRPRKSATPKKKAAQADAVPVTLPIPPLQAAEQHTDQPAHPPAAHSPEQPPAQPTSPTGQPADQTAGQAAAQQTDQAAHQPAGKNAKKPTRRTAAKKNASPGKKVEATAETDSPAEERIKFDPESPVKARTEFEAAPENATDAKTATGDESGTKAGEDAASGVTTEFAGADGTDAGSETVFQAPAAGQPEAEPREKSRRSRSRRGRRKSAAARAAAQAILTALADPSLASAAAEDIKNLNDADRSESNDGLKSADHSDRHDGGWETAYADNHDSLKIPDETADHEDTTGAASASHADAESEPSRLDAGLGLGTRPSARLNTWQAGEQSGSDATDETDQSDDIDEAGAPGETGATGAARKSKDKAAKAGAKEARETSRPKSKMFVSVLPGEQVEVVIASEGLVQEYYVEMLHQVKVKGNIYKGVIHNVDPNLQAAFVSYGAVKNGFLQIDEVHPEYYLTAHEPGKGHKYPLIQKVLKPGQEILVQVVKEPAGTKGAFLTSYLSLPGRFLVLTPGREQIGISRKVDNEEERARLRDLLSGLNPGEGLGVIVRTVSRGATKTSLQRDLQQLKRLWKEVRKKGSTEHSPCLIYQELGLDTRAVRDYLTEDVSELWVDDEEMAGQLREIVSLLFPRRGDMVHVHKDVDTSLFERFSLKKQLDQVHAREVTLPSGGRLVFDHTEALVAIDINSGRAAGKNNFEDTAYKTNLEAAQMIPLQLRLRDIGGQVVIDFIEMRDRGHWREVEKAIRNGMKVDRARHDVGKISNFGLLEIVRQRLSSSAISVTSEPCPCCKGTGQRRNLEWQAQQALREIRSLLRKNSEAGGSVLYNNNAELVLYLLNNKRERLLELERAAGVKLELRIA